MIPPSFDCEAPNSVEEAIVIFRKNPEAKILASGLTEKLSGEFFNCVKVQIEL